SGGSTSTTVANPIVLPEVAIGDVNLQQGDTGTRQAVVTLTLDKPFPYPVIVNVRSEADPSNQGAYGAINKQVRFGPYVTVKTLIVPVYGSATNDLDKQAVLDVAPMVNARIEKGEGTVSVD